MKTHGKHGMVCEKERIGNNRPCPIPQDFLLINKDTHELDDGKCWVCLWLLLAADIVIGVRNPTSLSWIALSVHEQASAREGHGIVCEHTICKLGDWLSKMLKATQHVRKTGSSPEVLLFQTQLLPNCSLSAPICVENGVRRTRCVVIWIKYGSD